MAILNKPFVTSDIADDVWPAGKYKVEITKSEIRETKKNTGQYLAVGFKCIEGKFKGEMVFNNYNLWNISDQARSISEKEMAKVCRAVGKPAGIESDTNEIHNIPLMITVTQRDADDPYPGNDIKGYSACASDGSAPSKNPFKK
ncbi:MAG: hypothetical protein DRQ35_03660 [Gammaproteobacteria bacterium]|nr:MAG: hypothetical protein DRQ35_03660 [Gammaproteobacteria bacterium]